MNCSCSLLVSKGGPWPLVVLYYIPKGCIPFTFLITILCFLNNKKLQLPGIVSSASVCFGKDKGHCRSVKNCLRKVLLYLYFFYYYDLQLSGKCINFLLVYFLFSPQERRQNSVLSLDGFLAVASQECAVN